MTGLGFFIFCVSWFAAYMFDHLALRTAERVALLGCMAGAASMVCGISLWLLKVMP